MSASTSTSSWNSSSSSSRGSWRTTSSSSNPSSCHNHAPGGSRDSTRKARRSSDASRSSSGSRRAGRKPHRSVHCIRTVLSGELSPPLASPEQRLHERLEEDANAATETTGLPTPCLERRESVSRDDMESVWTSSSRSSWRKLTHRRRLTKLFNFEPKQQSEMGLAGLLVEVHFPGSAGAIRLMVDKGEEVQRVTELALRTYESQKRRPALGGDPRLYSLYCQGPEFQVMEARSCVGEHGVRHLYLYRNYTREGDLSEGSGEDASKGWFFGSVLWMPIWRVVAGWGWCAAGVVRRNVCGWVGYLPLLLFQAFALRR